MIRLINLVLLSLLPLVLSAQEKCNCPENYNYKEATKKVFKFKNGHRIGLCGSYQKDEKNITYSEFAIFDCNTREPLREWDATASCIVLFKNDTLYIADLEWLPYSKNFSYQSVAIDTTKFFYSSDRFIKTNTLNIQLPKYSKENTDAVLNKSKGLEKLNRAGYHDSIVVISKMLFCAYTSGSKEAERYLNTIEKKYGPFDGGVSEEWNRIWMLYLHYKEQSAKQGIKR